MCGSCSMHASSSRQDKTAKIAPESEISPAHRPSLTRLFKNLVHLAALLPDSGLRLPRKRSLSSREGVPQIPFWNHTFARVQGGFHLPTLYSFLSPWPTTLSWDLVLPSSYLTVSSKALCGPISFSDYYPRYALTHPSPLSHKPVRQEWADPRG